MSIEGLDWVKQSVFYQIFPDRFAKENFLNPRQAILRSACLEDWEALPSSKGYKGGNLWGALSRLDYLKDLGINVIYFTPVFQSASNHRYHTHDYYQVDPLLGGNEALTALLETAHQNDFRVVLDGVFNHCGRGFFFFNDILENGRFSPWVNWFHFREKAGTKDIDWSNWASSAYGDKYPANYKGWVGDRALPVLNHGNPAVREYTMQVAEFWIKMGIDGWRLDVPFEIKVPGFWQEFRQRVKAINPEAYIVGEIWGDASEWLDGTQFDGVMNYLFAAPTIAFTAGDCVIQEMANPACKPYPPLDAPGYAEKIQQLLTLYPWEIQLTQLNLLNSHDTARLITMASGDKASVELATLLLLTFPGAPCIYYGDEVGLEGGPDPDCRRGFPSEDKWDRDVLDYHRQLISLRHSYPALRTGDYQFLYAQGFVYVFARVLNEGEPVIIAVNAGNKCTRVSVEPNGVRLPEASVNTLKTRPRVILYGSGQADWIDGEKSDSLNLILPARSGLIVG
jgi:cyclomaltodextrinase